MAFNENQDTEWLNDVFGGVDTPNTGEGGNTVSPSLGVSSMRRVCFTLNGYDNTDLSRIVEICTNRNYKYSIGKEVGSNGNQHLQGYIEFPKPKKFQTVKNLLPRAHIEAAKGTKQENRIYTQKDGDFVTNIEPPIKERLLRDLYNNVNWYDWQRDIIELYDQPPDTRHIHWIVDRLGNRGKSYLTKYLYLKHNVLIADGKKADVFHQIAKRFEDEENPDEFTMVILDIPRHQCEYINYGLLEQLKNGLIMSGKYEGGTFVFPTPHLVVMANIEPDFNKFSQDRWKMHYLD